MSGGIGGRPEILSGLSRQCLGLGRLPPGVRGSLGLPAGGAPAQLHGSVPATSAGREATKPREAELPVPSPPLRVWELRRLPGSCFCLFFPKLLWLESKNLSVASPDSLYGLCVFSFLCLPSLPSESSVSSVSVELKFAPHSLCLVSRASLDALVMSSHFLSHQGSRLLGAGAVVLSRVPGLGGGRRGSRTEPRQECMWGLPGLG